MTFELTSLFSAGLTSRLGGSLYMSFLHCWASATNDNILVKEALTSKSDLSRNILEDIHYVDFGV